MVKLIVKSPYLKCTGSSAAGAGGYLHYIGTREHVELIPDDRGTAHRKAGERLSRHERIA